MKLNINAAAAGSTKITIEPGRHIGKICQVANVGCQKAFNAGDPPEPKLGVAFELGDGTLVARTLTVSGSMFSLLAELIDAAGLMTGEEFDAEELLGHSVAIEIDQNDRGFVKLTGFGRIEDFEDPIEGEADLLFFDIDDVPADRAEANAILRNLHSEIRQAISRRVKGEK